MKKQIALVLVISLLSLQNGCLRTYYPAVYHSSAPPLVTETNNAVDVSSKYLGTDFTIAKGSYDNELVQLMRINFLLVNTQDHTNFNLEGFGYTGNYRVSGLDAIYDGDKSLFGIGVNAKINVNFKFNKVKIGMGLNLGGGIEFGEYYQFRKEAEGAHRISDENNLMFVLFYGTPMVSYEFTESTILSLQASAGLPGVLTPSLVLNHNKISYWISWLPDKNISENYYGTRITFGVMIGLQDLHLNF
ncbi:MAG: hypothetical protein MUF28_02295 [Ignavibacterium sp.]|jgi:hypothetical protein|nr:hypothetical protein [Ignavibacterium sp.]